jgi:hypothetical protein
VLRVSYFRLPGSCYLLNAAKVYKVSVVFRRSLLTVNAILIGGTLLPSIYAASMDLDHMSA